MVEVNGAKQPTIPPNIFDTSARSRGNSSTDSEPPTPGTEHGDTFTPDSSPEMEKERVFRPYAIEEPDDEPTPDMQPLKLPCLPDNLERWQRDLVDYVDDERDVRPRNTLDGSYSGQTRGQKRKPGNAASAGYPNAFQVPHSKQSSRHCDSLLSVPGPGASPKRRRRRSKLPGDTCRPSQMSSMYDFRDPRPEDSSDSEMRSSDESAESSPEYAATDDMELD